MADYIRAIDGRTKQQRVQDKWSHFCHVWRQVAWWYANPWRTFERVWVRIYWAEMHGRKLWPYRED